MSLPDECRTFIAQNHLLDCDAVVVAVSGGPDSMCLLDIFLSLAKDESDGQTGESAGLPKIVVAHLNHGLRGEESDADEELVRLYCERRGVPFFSRKRDIALMARSQGLGLEETGRNERYAFFDEVAERLEKDGLCVRVAVAHRREDRAETMLINLFRGTGPDGLCAMRPLRGRIIRPILFASKDRILEHNRDHNVPFRIDASNSETDYTRNKWRNVLIPLIRETSSKDPVDALLSVADLLGSDKDYFDGVVGELFEANRIDVAPGATGIPGKFLEALHPSLSSRLVRRLFSECFGDTTDFPKDQVEKVMALAADGRSNRSLSLSSERIAGMHAGVLFFADRNRALFFDPKGAPADCPGCKLSVARCLDREFLVLGEEEDAGVVLSTDMLEQTIGVISEKSGNRLFSVELKSVENPAQVVYNNRTWYCPVREIDGVTFRKPRPQDHIRPAGSAGGKLFRRFLTDRKVPAILRRGLIVAVRDHAVLWVPGFVHTTGFTDALSNARFLDGLGIGSLFDKDAPPICKVTIIPG